MNKYRLDNSPRYDYDQTVDQRLTEIGQSIIDITTIVGALYPDAAMPPTKTYNSPVVGATPTVGNIELHQARMAINGIFGDQPSYQDDYSEAA